MRVCTRCKLEDGKFVTVHEHHKNGDHEDNRPENKMDLCANCHMTLHWKRWKLSDIGLEDVEIISKRTHFYNRELSRRSQLDRTPLRDFECELMEANQNISALIKGISYFVKQEKFNKEKYQFIFKEVLGLIDEQDWNHNILYKMVREIYDNNIHLYKFPVRQSLNLEYQDFERATKDIHEIYPVFGWRIPEPSPLSFKSNILSEGSSI